MNRKIVVIGLTLGVVLIGIGAVVGLSIRARTIAYEYSEQLRKLNESYLASCRDRIREEIEELQESLERNSAETYAIQLRILGKTEELKKAGEIPHFYEIYETRKFLFIKFKVSAGFASLDEIMAMIGMPTGYFDFTRGVYSAKGIDTTGLRDRIRARR